MMEGIDTLTAVTAILLVMTGEKGGRVDVNGSPAGNSGAVFS